MEGLKVESRLITLENEHENSSKHLNEDLIDLIKSKNNSFIKTNAQAQHTNLSQYLAQKKFQNQSVEKKVIKFDLSE